MSALSRRSPWERPTGLLTSSSVVMIVLGSIAILVPHAAGIVFSIFVGWVLVGSGLAHLVYAFASWGLVTFLWRSVVGLFYLAGGMYLIVDPGLSQPGLTLAVAAILLFEGLLETTASFVALALPGSGWLLLDGMVTLLLSYFIWRSWPSSASWAIGTLIGVNLIVSGWTRLFHCAALRRQLRIADGL